MTEPIIIEASYSRNYMPDPTDKFTRANIGMVLRVPVPASASALGVEKAFEDALARVMDNVETAITKETNKEDVEI